MTLALYGKSRKRQGGLVGLGLLAAAIAIVAALWSITAAFAHHLESDIIEPTCEDQRWKVQVSTGDWGNYREAVLTETGSTNVEMAFTPFIYRGPDTFIVNVSGTGAVDTQGMVQQYDGSFGDSEDPNHSIDADDTQVTVQQLAGFGTWDSDYQVGTVILWDNELMLVTARSPNGKVLTVQRGFGGTAAVAHNDDGSIFSPFDDITRWRRGDLEGNPNTIPWDLGFNPDDCAHHLTIEKSEANGVNPGDWTMTIGTLPLPGSVLDSGPGSASAEVAPGSSYHISESGPGGWQLASVQCTDDGQNNIDPEPNFGANSRVLSIPQDVVGDVTCVFTNRPVPTFTITAEKVICQSEADLPNWAGSADPATHDRVQQFVDESEGRCHFAREWVFEVNEVAGQDQPRPDDNIEDAPNYTDFTGTINLPIPDGNLQYRIREQLPAGYIPFTGVGGSDVSAEFYCGDDVANYDNLEWAGPGDTYCVGFNAPRPITIKAWKVVCDNEAALPDWGDGAADITAATAQSFVSASNGACQFQDGWAFEYAWDASDPGDNQGDLGGWTNFDSVTSGGASQVPAMATVQPGGGTTLWAREIWSDDYVPFSGATSGSTSVSAEFYCTADVLNWDNRERIEETSGGSDEQPGGEYHCVGFNVLEQAEIIVEKVVPGIENDPTVFAARINIQGGGTQVSNIPFSEAGGPVSTNVPPGDYNVRERFTEAPASFPDGYTYAGYSMVGLREACPDSPQSTNRDAPVSLEAGDAVKVCFYNDPHGEIIVKKVYLENGQEIDVSGEEPTITFDGVDQPNDDDDEWTKQQQPNESLTIDETPAAGWVFDHVDISEGCLLKEAPQDNPEVDFANLVLETSEVAVGVAPGDECIVTYYNAAVGSVVLIKNETHQSAGAETWNFNSAILSNPVLNTAANNTQPPATTSDQLSFDDVPVGSYSINEVEGVAQCTAGSSATDFQTNAKAQVGSIPNPDPTADLVANGPINFSVQRGQTTYIVFENQGCGTVLSAANIVVRKFQDNDADLDPNDEPALGGWSITIEGTGGPAAGFGPFTQQTDGSGTTVFAGVPDGTYTISESLSGGYTAVGSTYRVSVGGTAPGANENGASGASRSGLSVGLNETLVVHFFNREPGSIEVTKTVSDQQGLRTRAGWTFQLTGGCTGVAQSLTTGASGVVVFDNLLPTDGCGVPYLVTEQGANSDGFTVSPSGTQAVHVNPGDESAVEFHNSRGITPFVVPTPTNTPTNTPTTPPDATATPEPTETVAGEITPGPASPTPTDEPGSEATPIAPDSGTGTAGSAGASTLLVLLGLAAITLGSGFLAVARKRS